MLPHQRSTPIHFGETLLPRVIDTSVIAFETRLSHTYFLVFSVISLTEHQNRGRTTPANYRTSTFLPGDIIKREPCTGNVTVTHASAIRLRHHRVSSERSDQVFGHGSNIRIGYLSTYQINFGE